MNDVEAMQLALQAADSAIGRTAPNPPVGAVIVRGDQVLGIGATQPPGAPHAEIMALQDAAAKGFDVRGATMVVTLEPCCHHGKTPPCTDAILHAGLARVVIGVVDPYPAVSGGGIAALEAGGVAITLGVCAQAASARMRGFLRVTTGGLPEVTAKVATSLDGHIATASGESQWITSEAARTHAHQVRAQHDAVLVGIGTVLADDPRLTVRLPHHETAGPVPAVLDTHLRIPAASALLHGPRRALIVAGPEAPERPELPADLVRVPLDEHGHVDLELALRALGERGLHRVLVEGGALIHRTLIDRDLVDTWHVYVASVLIAGGKPWVGGRPVAHLSEAKRLPAPSLTTLAGDLLLTYDMHAGHTPKDD